MSLGPGTMVTERIRLERLLGEGGMGSVWVAEHLTLGTRVAVKFISVELAKSHPELKERFLREAAASAKIASPHVARTFDFGAMSDGTPFLVMELLEGESFHEHLKANAPLEVEDVLWLLEGLLEPLAAAHKAGVTHRDLKPTNVFITKVGGEQKVKLLDFGVAHRVDRERFTAPEVTVGSLGFMGPEQLTGNVVPQSDLYAVGCVAWLLLVGQPVFPYRAMGELARNHMLTVPPLIRTARADVPPPLERWIARLLEKEYARRPANAFEALLELRLAMEELGESTVLETQAPTQAVPALRRAPTDPETRQVVVVEPAPSATLDEDDPESTVRIIPGRPRR